MSLTKIALKHAKHSESATYGRPTDAIYFSYIPVTSEVQKQTAVL